MAIAVILHALAIVTVVMLLVLLEHVQMLIQNALETAMSVLMETALQLTPYVLEQLLPAIALAPAQAIIVNLVQTHMENVVNQHVILIHVEIQSMLKAQIVEDYANHVMALEIV